MHIQGDYIGLPEYQGVKVELNQDIQRRVMEHRNKFHKLIYNRFVEFLPLLINYTNAYRYKGVSVDFTQLEIALRQNYNTVVGQARNGLIMILGYINDTHYNIYDNYSPFSRNYQERLTHENINFTVPEHLIPERMLEISFEDGCQSGNFIVVRNKPVNTVNDFEVIKHYTDELAEVTLSRFSLIMQSKFAKIFKSEINDETVNQFISELFNGSPFIKVSKGFFPDQNIIDLGSDYITTAMVELKREYQNKISELANFLGVNSLAVDKESGVSDVEAKSNRGFTTANSNIYLKGRESFEKLNRRYDLDIHAYYDDEALSTLTIKEMHGGSDSSNQDSENSGGGFSE